jgi:hypothetical protein
MSNPKYFRGNDAGLARQAPRTLTGTLLARI